MPATESRYSLQPRTAESVRPELPTLQPGVSIALLRRVWFATPSDRRVQLSSLLESRVLVAGRAKALRLLTLAEVEQAIGAVTPRYFVRWYQPGKVGAQITTFVEQTDAEQFAAPRKLYGRPAVVRPIR
jgi:hypothetical protein